MSTNSLLLFVTATDAFVDMVSSIVILVTSRLATRPNVVKYPIGRRRVETISVILFYVLMAYVEVELIIKSGRGLASGPKESKDL